MNRLLNVAEVAEYLNVSKWTIYQWVSRKYIPYFKLRGAVRFRTCDVDKWLSKNQVQGRSLHRLRIESNAS